MTKKTIFYLGAAVLLFTAFVYGSGVDAACRNGGGGHCVELAAIAQAQVPGLEFLNVGLDIGQIFARLYVFGLSLVGISALIMLVIGGIMYLTAGDSESRAKTARDYMGNAVLGLVLALLSYLILFTINPDLVGGAGWVQNLRCLQPAGAPMPAPASGFCP